MKQFKQLRKFSNEELFLTEEEAIIVLKFIFSPEDHKLIDAIPMSNSLINFAQGLLVEAIDASYSIGFIQALFESTSNPSKSALKIIKNFGKKAAKHWFKHARTTDLQNVKIYDFVKNKLAWSFRSQLQLMITGNIQQDNIAAFVAYNPPKNKIIKQWA